jgi:hypothetical protein
VSVGHWPAQPAPVALNTCIHHTLWNRGATRPRNVIVSKHNRGCTHGQGLPLPHVAVHMSVRESPVSSLDLAVHSALVVAHTGSHGSATASSILHPWPLAHFFIHKFIVTSFGCVCAHASVSSCLSTALPYARVALSNSLARQDTVLAVVDTSRCVLAHTHNGSSPSLLFVLAHTRSSWQA